MWCVAKVDGYVVVPFLAAMYVPDSRYSACHWTGARTSFPQTHAMSGHWNLILHSVILAPRIPESTGESDLILADWPGLPGPAGSNLVLWHLYSNFRSTRQGQFEFALDMLLPESPNQPRRFRINSIPESSESTSPPEWPESWLRPNWPNWIAARIGSCRRPESPNGKIDKLDCFPNPRIGSSSLQCNSSGTSVS